MERRLSIGLGPNGAFDFSVSFQHRLLDLVPFLLLSPRFRTPAWAQTFPSRAPVPIWIKEAVLLRWQGKGIAGHCRLSISDFVKHFHSCSKKKKKPIMHLLQWWTGVIPCQKVRLQQQAVSWLPLCPSPRLSGQPADSCWGKRNVLPMGAAVPACLVFGESVLLDLQNPSQFCLPVVAMYQCRKNGHLFPLPTRS